MLLPPTGDYIWGKELIHETPDGRRGMYLGGSVGLATSRRDGFASMDAGESVGTLTTRPLEFDGQFLFVNVDCPNGELRAELLDYCVPWCFSPLGQDQNLERLWPRRYDSSATRPAA